MMYRVVDCMNDQHCHCHHLQAHDPAAPEGTETYECCDCGHQTTTATTTNAPARTQ